MVGQTQSIDFKLPHPSPYSGIDVWTENHDRAIVLQCGARFLRKVRSEKWAELVLATFIPLWKRGKRKRKVTYSFSF